MSLKNWVLLSLLSILWGSSFFFYEKLLIFVNPIQVVILRMTFAAIFLSAYCLVMQLKLPKKLSDWGIIFVMALLVNSIPFTLFAYAQTYISGSLAAILNSNTAFFGLLVAVIFIAEERFSILKVVGLLVGLSGVTVAIGFEHIFELSIDNIGQWLVVLATLCYAFAGVWGRIKMAHLSGVAICCAMMICSSIQILLVGLLTNSVFTLSLQLETFIFASGIGFFCTALAYLLYLKIIREAGASNASLVTLLIPIVAITINSFALDESLKQNEMIGFLIIFTGLIVLNSKLLQLKLLK